MTTAIPSTSPWTLPISGTGRHIASISTASTEKQLIEASAIVQAWRLQVEFIDNIFHLFLSNITKGTVLIARDSEGAIQAVARVTHKPECLEVDEIMAAPSNRVDEIMVAPRMGTGTLMMYGVCRYAMRGPGERIVRLTSSGDACGFYKNLGMRRGSGRQFTLDLTLGMPKSLLGRVQKYFPDQVPFQLSNPPARGPLAEAAKQLLLQGRFTPVTSDN